MRKKKGGMIFAVAAILMLSIGDGFQNQVAGQNEGKCPDAIALEPPSAILGMSLQCRPIKAETRGSGEETVLLLGAIHGSERLTGPTVERFDREVLSKPEVIVAHRKVIVVPYVNPDGYALEVRTNANGVDINRNFPTRNWKEEATYETFPPGPFPASEPETRAIVKLIEMVEPVLIISVHSPLGMINFDGPARKIAKVMSRASGLKLKKHIGYSTPGSLGTYAGKERRIPTITIELPEAVNIDEFWEPIKEALILAINY
jgi:protein MpaA